MPPADSSIGWPGEPWKHAQVQVELREGEEEEEDEEEEEEEYAFSKSNTFSRTMKGLEQESEEQMRLSQTAEQAAFCRLVGDREEKERELVRSRERGIHDRHVPKLSEERDEENAAEHRIVIPVCRDYSVDKQTRCPIMTSNQVKTLTLKRAGNKIEQTESTEIVNTNTSRSVGFKRHSLNDAYDKQTITWKAIQTKAEQSKRLDMLVLKTRDELVGKSTNKQNDPSMGPQRPVISSKMSFAQKNFKDLIHLKRRVATMDTTRQRGDEASTGDKSGVEEVSSLEKAEKKTQREDISTFYGMACRPSID
eukprot:530533-Hanusia_phi.AAC.2